MKNTYYLIDTSNWTLRESSGILSQADADAKNAGYMHSNSPLRWYHGDMLKSLPIKWTPK